jgi:hypothetical protein
MQNKKTVKFRPYQLKCTEKILKYFSTTNNKGLVQSATGTGKTIIMSMLTFMPSPYLFLAHRNELLDQLKNTLSPSETTSIQKLSRLSEKDLEHYLSKFQTIFIDEAHHSASPTYSRIIYKIKPNQYLLGFTATPYRYDEKDLSFAFGKIPIFQYPLIEAIKDGFLVDIKAIKITTTYDWKEIFKTEPTAQLIGKQYDKHESLILGVKHAISICEKPALIFMPTIQSAKKLDFPIIHHKLPKKERNKILESFKSNQDILVNVELLTEGFDMPDIRSVILARPTKSTVLYSQMVGRATRLSSNAYHISESEKKYCTIYEFSSSNDQRSELFNDIWSLSGLTPPNYLSKSESLLTLNENIKINTKQIILKKIQEFDFFKVSSNIPQADWIQIINGSLILLIAPPGKTSELYIISKPNIMGYSTIIKRKLNNYEYLLKASFNQCLKFCDKLFAQNFDAWLWKQSTRKKWSKSPPTLAQKESLARHNLKPTNKLQASRLLNLIKTDMLDKISQEIMQSL